MKVEDVPEEAKMMLNDAPIAIKEILTTAIQTKSNWEDAKNFIADRLDELLEGAQETLEKICGKTVWLERDY